MPEAEEHRANAIRALVETTPAEAWIAVIDAEVEPSLREWAMAWAEAAGRGDLDGVLAAAHPEIVVSQPAGIPDAKSYRGHEGMIENLNDWPAQWEEFRLRPKRIWEPRPGRLMLLARHRGRGAGSGIEIEVDVWWLFDFRDGLLARWQMFLTEDEAEAALG